MNNEIKARLYSLKEMIDISRERNAQVRDGAESNINSLKLISQSIEKLKAELLEDGIID